MTTIINMQTEETCPAQALIRLLSGKWKPEIFRSAVDGAIRFSGLLREIKGANKQTLAVALKELKDVGLLRKVIVKEKPLHIEYYLTENGKALSQFLSS